MSKSAGAAVASSKNSKHRQNILVEQLTSWGWATCNCTLYRLGYAPRLGDSSSSSNIQLNATMAPCSRPQPPYAQLAADYCQVCVHACLPVLWVWICVNVWPTTFTHLVMSRCGLPLSADTTGSMNTLLKAMARQRCICTCWSQLFSTILDLNYECGDCPLFRIAKNLWNSWNLRLTKIKH